MDILISSNLERLLWHVSGSSDKVADWMRQLAQTGRYTVDAETLAAIQASFDAGFADDAQGAEEIRARFAQDGYLCDTHTAVAFLRGGALPHGGPDGRTVYGQPVQVPARRADGAGADGPRRRFCRDGGAGGGRRRAGAQSLRALAELAGCALPR